MNNNFIKLGTRGSKLALWQANHVAELLTKVLNIQTEIVVIQTTGDQLLNQPLSAVGGKGLFLKEIEEALLSNQIDLAVHSLKDVPTQVPAGLILPIILPRAEAWDVLVTCQQPASTFGSQKRVSVGTSSLRRQNQLQVLWPKAEFKLLRGNIDTRLKKLKAGEFDGIVLAKAGLIRLGLDSDFYLTDLAIVPAVGQGALALECRANDFELQQQLLPLHHLPTAKCVIFERQIMQKFGADCFSPFGAFVEYRGQELLVRLYSQWHSVWQETNWQAKAGEEALLLTKMALNY